jgi:hypothetical protein
MKHFRLYLGSALLLSIFLVGITIALATRSSADASASLSSPHHPPAQNTFQVTTSYVPGNPAISPHVSAASSGNNSSIPAFSKKDVTDFLNKNGFYAGPVVNGAHLKILSIQFVTAKQASDLMYGESVGRPDTYLVCYVKVQGPFSRMNMHAGPNLPGRKVKTTANIGDMVFDAHTGNLLVWGVY